MVMIGRFSSDDPGWREPWDRETSAANDDSDWPDLDPRPTRTTPGQSRTRNTSSADRKKPRTHRD